MPIAKRVLSGSTNGRGIKVAATASPGTLIHTAVTGTASLDEVWLYAVNTSTNPVALTLQWGGTTSPDDEITVNIGAKGVGKILVAAGILLQNDLVIRAYAGTTNVININGYVNRIA